MIKFVKTTLKQLPYISGLHEEISRLRTELTRYRTWVPPGHYYSPIPNLDEVQRDAHFLFSREECEVSGIDMRREAQLKLLQSLAEYYCQIPFAEKKATDFRYYFDNSYYSYADAIILYCMIRHIRPSKIIEVGSGYSSAVILDTNDIFFNKTIKCTFIDPHTDRLEKLITELDRHNNRIIANRVQDVSLDLFGELSEGDFLFIDSSHVTKTGSDLNHILFNVLPVLKSGVYIHFHDIFYPFEYPKKWIFGGVSWNEAYMLRSFLQYNSAFHVCLFTAYLMQCHREQVAVSLPLALKSEVDDPSINDAPGGSIWLRKL